MTYVPAVTVRRATADGLVELKDGVPLGKEYLVDLGSRRDATLYHRDRGVLHRKEIVETVGPDGAVTGWLPTEILAFRCSLGGCGRPAAVEVHWTGESRPWLWFCEAHRPAWADGASALSLSDFRKPSPP